MLWVRSSRVRKLVLVLLLTAALMPSRGMALPPVEAMLAERSMGSPTAPVTVVEYSSLTCPHCADFHRETLPKIKEAYIDKGVVRYVLRDFPLEPRAMAAAMVARCLPADRYFGFVGMLFRDQETWAHSRNPIEDLKVRAQLAGLPPADFDACLADQDLLKGIQAAAAEAQKRDGIDSTPTLLVDGRKISGAAPFDEFRSAIDEAVAQAR
jgi:protein-disulfide isomerase